MDPALLSEAFLAPADGDWERKYSLIESIHEGAVLKVRVAPFAPADGLFLYVEGAGQDRLLRSLVEQLERMESDGPVNGFGTRRLARIPAPSTALPRERAAAACRSPGLHMVWGPPGTGKTGVIATALRDLIRDGQTVLLVSGTNVAVDNALERAAGLVNPTPGVMVRVGTPQIRAVGEDDRLSLSRLRERKLAALIENRETVAARIRELSSLDRVRRVVDADATIGALSGFQAARRRVDAHERLERLRERVMELRDGRTRVDEAAERAREAWARECARWDETASAREHLREAEAVEDELRRHAVDLDRAAAAALRAEANGTELRQQLDELERSSWLGRLTERRERRTLSDRLRAAERDVDEARRRRDELRQLLERLQPQLADRVRRHRQAAHPFAPGELERRRAALAQADEARREADAAASALEAELSSLESRLIAAERAPAPTDEDFRLVQRAAEVDLAGLVRRLPAWRTEAKAELDEIAKLEKEHERLLARQRLEERDIERRIVDDAAVVATTLAMLRLKPAVHERRYDHVIVDEVAASPPAEVMCAVSRAAIGAVLLGDFLQNGPIDGRKGDDVATQRWLGTDCFGLFGIHDPASAQRHPGCATLVEQGRFGPAITRLANAVAYDGALRAARTEPRPADDPEIVLIDVDGLGARWTGIRRPSGSSSCWPVGALLARALAQQHLADRGEATIGVVTPYRAQRDLIERFFVEADVSPRAEVGTAHRFQGREFDTVIFDLVENGGGWVASGALRGNIDGLRVFNVGTTRARRRLYVIVNGAAVRRAATGPLRALRHLEDAGALSVVRAARVLGLPEGEMTPGVERDVWQACRSYVQVLATYDEDGLVAELCRRIDGAHHSVWLWSPWVGRRMRELLAPLRRAHQRGVAVRIVTLPAADVSRQLRTYLDELTAAIPGVLFLQKEHEKLAVIDERLTFIGSMNVLSHTRGKGRRETMSLLESRAYAEDLLRFERAGELARPPACKACGRQAVEFGLLGRDRGRRLHWLCAADGHRPWTRPFADDPAGRNQPRMRR